MDGNRFDLAIVGGGLAGCSLACALAGSGLRLALIDSAAPEADGALASHDERVLALAYGSRRILEGLGVWGEVALDAAAIEHIHVSDRGHFGSVRLEAREEGVEALGYVVPLRPLGRALTVAARTLPAVEFLAPASCEEAETDADGVRLTVRIGETSREIEAKLLVLADGGRSGLAERFGIAQKVHDYGQSAVIANVTCSRPLDGWAWERFTDTGPLALLPLGGVRASLVWSVVREEAEAVAALPDGEFLERLQARFGHRAGRFLETGPRHVYPLKLIQAKAQVGTRLVLVGNAAHTLHPIAGQGFNLGLRDVAVLAELLMGAADPGAPALLKQYERRRKLDQRRTIGLTDTLAKLFSNRILPLVAARGVGLLALELAPGLKHLLSGTTLGLAPPVPRLTRGVPLRPE